MCPGKPGLIASVDNKGRINLFQTSFFENHSKEFNRVGLLLGNREETFCLNWNKQKSNLVASAASNYACIWDLEKHTSDDKQIGEKL